MTKSDKKIFNEELVRLKKAFDMTNPGDYFCGYYEGEAKGYLTAFFFTGKINEKTFRKHSAEINQWGTEDDAVDQTSEK